MECAIDCESANAAVEDADGKVAVQLVWLLNLFEDLGNRYAKTGNRIVD